MNYLTNIQFCEDDWLHAQISDSSQRSIFNILNMNFLSASGQNAVANENVNCSNNTNNTNNNNNNAFESIDKDKETPNDIWLVYQLTNLLLSRPIAVISGKISFQKTVQEADWKEILFNRNNDALRTLPLSNVFLLKFNAMNSVHMLAMKDLASNGFKFRFTGDSKDLSITVQTQLNNTLINLDSKFSLILDIPTLHLSDSLSKNQITLTSGKDGLTVELKDGTTRLHFSDDKVSLIVDCDAGIHCTISVSKINSNQLMRVVCSPMNTDKMVENAVSDCNNTRQPIENHSSSCESTSLIKDKSPENCKNVEHTSDERPVASSKRARSRSEDDNPIVTNNSNEEDFYELTVKKTKTSPKQAPKMRAKSKPFPKPTYISYTKVNDTLNEFLTHQQPLTIPRSSTPLPQNIFADTSKTVFLTPTTGFVTLQQQQQQQQEQNKNFGNYSSNAQSNTWNRPQQSLNEFQQKQQNCFSQKAPEQDDSRISESISQNAQQNIHYSVAQNNQNTTQIRQDNLAEQNVHQKEQNQNNSYHLKQPNVQQSSVSLSYPPKTSQNTSYQSNPMTNQQNLQTSSISTQSQQPQMSTLYHHQHQQQQQQHSQQLLQKQQNHLQQQQENLQNSGIIYSQQPQNSQNVHQQESQLQQHQQQNEQNIQNVYQKQSLHPENVQDVYQQQQQHHQQLQPSHYHAYHQNIEISQPSQMDQAASQQRLFNIHQAVSTPSQITYQQKSSTIMKPTSVARSTAATALPQNDSSLNNDKFQISSPSYDSTSVISQTLEQECSSVSEISEPRSILKNRSTQQQQQQQQTYHSPVETSAVTSNNNATETDENVEKIKIHKKSDRETDFLSLPIVYKVQECFFSSPSTSKSYSLPGGTSRQEFILEPTSFGSRDDIEYKRYSANKNLQTSIEYVKHLNHYFLNHTFTQNEKTFNKNRTKLLKQIEQTLCNFEALADELHRISDPATAQLKDFQETVKKIRTTFDKIDAQIYSTCQTYIMRQLKKLASIFD